MPKKRRIYSLPFYVVRGKIQEISDERYFYTTYSVDQIFYTLYERILSKLGIQYQVRDVFVYKDLMDKEIKMRRVSLMPGELRKYQRLYPDNVSKYSLKTTLPEDEIVKAYEEFCKEK